jgi:(S)-2-hydroxyglutarate dehydrogenase
MLQHVAVVGGGILGLTTARELLVREPDRAVTVLEKEPALAQHQTGRNSGVVHAGVYYPPGSLKARLCRRGMTLLESWCAERALPYEACGKVVVATTPAEVAGLDAIEARARANGVPGLARLSAGALREVEPHATGLAALHSPRTAITDFAAVARSVADDVRARGGVVVLGAEVVGLRALADGVEVATPGGAARYDRVVVCAGLHADRLATLTGDDPSPRIVPFRGDYHRLRPERVDLVRGLVYPVPDPRYPFLGIHLTRTVHGEVLVGPNAALAFAREGYRLTDVDPRQLAATLRWAGFRRFAAQHWRTGLAELRRSASPGAFLAEARRYVPTLTEEDLLPGPSGVRAQALDDDGSLVDDFRISRRGRVVHVRNAPSPAATSSFAIAEELVARLDEDG